MRRYLVPRQILVKVEHRREVAAPVLEVAERRIVEGRIRVVRGGGFNSSVARLARSAQRNFDNPEGRDSAIGFRPARTIER